MLTSKVFTVKVFEGYVEGQCLGGGICGRRDKKGGREGWKAG